MGYVTDTEKPVLPSATKCNTTLKALAVAYSLRLLLK